MKDNRMPTILDDILKVKQDEVASLAPRLADLRSAARSAPPPRCLAAALRRGAVRHIRIIAEVKHQSPSAGVIVDPFSPAGIARQYAEAGADAISCLTDRQFFGGSIDDLREVRAAVDLPILRKDFIIDPIQVYEARAAGADAFLLIAEALEDTPMRDLTALGVELGMDVLAEAHSQAALERALACGAALVGINNRDLATFHVSLDTTVRLAPQVKHAGRTLVAESGIKTGADVSRLLACDVDAILVGEGLLRSGRIADKMAEFKKAR
jgi:indole-3-glycerol phosphate synthase